MYVRTYVHAYVRTYVRAYVRTYLRTYVSTYECTYVRKVRNVAQELHQTRAVLVLRYLFERRLANFDFFSKFGTVVYLPNMAAIGAKLWQNAFQTICNFSFFELENNHFGIVLGEKKSGLIFLFEKVRFWRS